MKKKAIEKVPYLGAKKCDKRSMKYVAAVEVMNIGNEEHLLIEIYENKKKCLKVPVKRFAYTKTDWANYSIADEYWSACGIINEFGNAQWNVECRKDGFETYINDTDFTVIREFVGHCAGGNRSWWKYIKTLESDIRSKRNHRSYARRQERLNERVAAVPELPDDFEEWYKKELFVNDNFIYYKRKGRYATFWCSHCGIEYTRATQAKDTYEGQFETIVNVPRNQAKSRCAYCDAIGRYKTVGNMKNVYGLRKDCYIAQPYGENGVISRYFTIEKMLAVGVPERFAVTEITRSYFKPEEKSITDYHLYNPWTGENEWHDHNIGGIGAQIKEKPGVIYPGSIELLKATAYKYCAIEQYLENYEYVGFADYLRCYQITPQIEILLKMGMYKMVNQIIHGRYGIIKDRSAKDMPTLFGINKTHIKMLVDSKGDVDLLNVLQMEKNLGVRWTDEQCEKLNLLNLPDEKKMKCALQYMTMAKLLNRIQKYAGTEFGDGCGRQIGILNHATTTYLDYLDMRRKCGYDLSNMIYQYPKDLEKEHNKMVLEVNKDADDIRKREVEENYPEIARNYRRLRKKYFYEDDVMFIRPAKSASEIVDEGRILHHCVGGDSYLSKHNRGESIILMLRFKKKPNSPYITVEIKGNKIQQWYGACDRKPDEENMERWIKCYVERLRTNRDGAAVPELMQIAG